MKELGYKNIETLEQIAAGDRDSARKMQMTNKSIMPAILTSGIAIAFGICLIALFNTEIPQSNRDLVVYMCGQLASFLSAALAFWLGTTRHSEAKTELLAKAQPIEG
jgi:hypothetical protein